MKNGSTYTISERVRNLRCTCEHQELRNVLDTITELREVEGPLSEAQRNELYMAAEHLNDAICNRHY